MSAYFSVPDSNKRYPSLWFGADTVDGEVTFVLAHEDGSLGLVTLDRLTDLAGDVLRGDVEFKDYFCELYARIPDVRGLHRCQLAFDQSDPDKPKLAVATDAATMKFDL